MITNKLRQNVPRLRFPGFDEKWIIDRLTNSGVTVVDGDRGFNYPNGNDFSSQGYCLFLNAKNVTKNGFSFSEKAFITKEKDKLLRKGRLIYDDIILTTRVTIGNIAHFDNTISYDRMRINSGMVLLRSDKKQILPCFLHKLIHTKKLQTQIKNIAFGSAQPQLTVSDILKLKLIMPPSINEQQKIANFLTAIDDKISVIDKKVIALKQYKKGVMQKIFSQQIRFKDENGDFYPNWEVKNLSGIGEIIGGGTPDTTNPKYWNGNINWLTPTEVKSSFINKTKRTITELGLKRSSAKLMPEGTVIFTSRATVGDVAISKIPLVTNQGFQSILVNDKNNNYFVYYWAIHNKKEFLRKSSGSTFLEISRTEIAKIKLSTPIKPEQEKIANLLTAIDQKITTEESKLKIVKEWKKGILQRMFV